jgi:hypothetical protein
MVLMSLSSQKAKIISTIILKQFESQYSTRFGASFLRFGHAKRTEESFRVLAGNTTVDGPFPALLECGSINHYLQSRFIVQAKLEGVERFVFHRHIKHRRDDVASIARKAIL